MDQESNCPSCGANNVYHDGNLWNCPDCGHEWSAQQKSAELASDETGQVIDANGNPLADGDSVSLIKDLKLKGSSTVIKGGTKVKNIRLTDGADGHNIACKIDGLGAINLKSEFVRKV